MQVFVYAASAILQVVQKRSSSNIKHCQNIYNVLCLKLVLSYHLKVGHIVTRVLKNSIGPFLGWWYACIFHE